ncbi:hypothetical protein PoB_005824600 [Plakobranchus ocellatus]|uniref:Uncharacterized protein n=1 Tax=Plakobranchus ocellatus TaxID=259542 RepID=A0AAV4CJQ4_9GAST|nr:hypothetical protein PoB_005824600 [Plakobranchus ocellatus]
MKQTSRAWSPVVTLGMEVQQKLDCLLDGVSRDPYTMLTLLFSGNSERRSDGQSVCSWTATWGDLHGCFSSSKRGL